jgi:cationic amino acid transporter 3
MKVHQFFEALNRKRRNDDEFDTSQLARKLNLFDLTTIGIGATLGLGVYILAGSVAYEQAGPAVTISFLVAAIASTFSGLCYSEFAARVPKAGSAYIYSYVSIGEFIGFTTGWNLILELIIGGSAVARGMSSYLDSLIDNQMGNFLKKYFSMDVDFLADYPDIFSFVIMIFFSILIAIGVKESSIINSVFAIVNMITILIIFVSGLWTINPGNWNIKKEDIPEGIDGGEGGFMPYGFNG